MSFFFMLNPKTSATAAVAGGHFIPAPQGDPTPQRIPTESELKAKSEKLEKKLPKKKAKELKARAIASISSSIPQEADFVSTSLDDLKAASQQPFEIEEIQGVLSGLQDKLQKLVQVQQALEAEQARVAKAEADRIEAILLSQIAFIKQLLEQRQDEELFVFLLQ